MGARRVKIRTILEHLDSGSRVFHEGVKVRENFDFDEFIRLAICMVGAEEEAAVVIESFIDADLAQALRLAWPGLCRILFITAPRMVRANRLADMAGVSIVEACMVVDRKDSRKRVVQQLATWREVADFWLENDGSLSTYKAQLSNFLATILAEEQ